MVNHSINATLTFDTSALEIDYGQPVEIVEHGAFSETWTLRDPEADVEVSGESYVEARRFLTAAKRIRKRVESEYKRAMHDAARDMVRVGAAP